MFRMMVMEWLEIVVGTFTFWINSLKEVTILGLHIVIMLWNFVDALKKWDDHYNTIFVGLEVDEYFK